MWSAKTSNSIRPFIYRSHTAGVQSVADFPQFTNASPKTRKSQYTTGFNTSFGPRFENPDILASVLSLEPDDLMPDVPIEVVSCGVPFLIVPVKTLQAVQRIAFQQSLWQQELAHLTSEILVFTQQTETPEANVHCRMFAPALGIAEDPATGSANGPLGAYLVRYGVVPSQFPTVSLLSEQGFEMGRPSLMSITIDHIDKEISGVRVGGHCVFIGEGVFEIDAHEYHEK